MRRAFVVEGMVLICLLANTSLLMADSAPPSSGCLGAVQAVVDRAESAAADLVASSLIPDPGVPGSYLQYTPNCVNLVVIPFPSMTWTYGVVDSSGTKDWSEKRSKKAANFTSLPGWSRNGCTTVALYSGPLIGGLRRFSADPSLTPSAFCSPFGLAYLFRILAHEVLHNICPPHAMRPKPKKGDPPPSLDCINLGYLVNTAAMIKAEICDINESITNADPGEQPLCPAVPGMDDCQAVADYCMALVENYEKVQQKTNTSANAALAFQCICSPGPGDDWSGAYPLCPPLKLPPDSSGNSQACAGNSAAQAFPNDEVIPDLGKECAACNV